MPDHPATSQKEPTMTRDEQRDQFLRTLDELIQTARDGNFRGATAAFRALKRVRDLAALR